jgi:hypothetical protein
MDLDLSEHAGTPFDRLMQTVTFEDAGSGKTRLVVVQRFESRAVREDVATAAAIGWESSFAKLDALLARTQTVI